MACALGREGFRGRCLCSGHWWLKLLGFFQELGPPPLIKRRDACNPLMFGQTVLLADAKNSRSLVVVVAL